MHRRDNGVFEELHQISKPSLKRIPSPPRRCKQLHHPQAPQRQEWRDSRGHIFQIPEANKSACPERSKPRAHVKGADSTFRCRSPDSLSIFSVHLVAASPLHIDGKHSCDLKTSVESSRAREGNIVSTFPQ